MAGTPQPLTQEQMDKLAPYAAGSQPDARGEWEIICPMHKDTRRSASVNIHKGVWFCHAGCGGGSVRQLVLNEDSWEPVDGRVQTLVSAPSTASTESVILPTKSEVQQWHRRLMRDDDVRAYLNRKRGLTNHTLRRASIGFNGKQYTIPVWSPNGRLWNVRKYDPNPRPGRSKIWNTKGMGTARLYPIRQLNRERYGAEVLYVEGEWDCLLALQSGHAAVTRTDGAGKPWHDHWTAQFVGVTVFMCCDRDRAGADAEAVAADALQEVTEVRWCHLPFKMKENHGKDLTDYLLKFPRSERGDVLTQLKEKAS